MLMYRSTTTRNQEKNTKRYLHGGCACLVKRPSLSLSFDYIHKKQSGGSGQYGRVMGKVEPMDLGDDADQSDGAVFDFVDKTVGNNLSKSYVPAISKGVGDACTKGPLTGNPVQGIRFTLTDGNQHAVDSSEMAFRAAGQGAMRECKFLRRAPRPGCFGKMTNMKY